MNMTSNRPYFIRAVYDWIVDNHMTPYLLVDAHITGVDVPEEHVSNGQIVLNISPQACRGLHLENDRILFSARFSGRTVQIFVPPEAVLAIYAKENGRGMEFGPQYDGPSTPPPASSDNASARKKPILKLVE